VAQLSKRLRSRRTNAGRDTQALRTALSAAIRRYRGHSNVVGIAAGTKFEDNVATDNDSAIQFFVRRKTRSRIRTAEPLPRFIYGRLPNGSVDRRRRFATDVILVGDVEPACGAGSQISVLGDGGTITMLFRNKVGDHATYLVTCAHVVGSYTEAPPFDRDIDGPACCPRVPFAQTLTNATHTNFTLPFDVALARVNGECSDQPDLAIEAGGRLTGFFATQDIAAGLPVQCELPVSMNSTAVVHSSHAGHLDLSFRGGLYSVENAYAMKVSVEKGDSGGLVYVDGLGVGIVFGRGEGWGWFNPLGDAVRFIVDKAGIPVTPF
jgi:hypothetical protein